MTAPTDDGVAGASSQAQSNSNGMWKIRRGTDEFVAASFAGLLHWRSEGHVLDSDLLYHPGIGQWVRVADVPALKGSLSGSGQRSGSKRPWLFLVGALVALPIIGVTTCTGAVALRALLKERQIQDEDAARRATKPQVLIVQAQSGVDEIGAEAYVVLLNVSGKELPRLTIETRWYSGGEEIAVGHRPLGNPPAAGNMASVEVGPVRLAHSAFGRANWVRFSDRKNGKATLEGWSAEKVRVQAMNLKIAEKINSGMRLKVIAENGTTIPFLYAGEREAAPYRQLVDYAMARARERAREDEQTTQQRLATEQREAAIKAAVQELRSINPTTDDRIGILRSWIGRHPREEARFSAEFRTFIEDRVAYLRNTTTPPLTDAEVQQGLQPVVDDLLARWQVEIGLATQGKPASE